MKLKSLKIETKWYGEFAGQYIGEVEFEGKDGKVSLVLPPDVSNLVLVALGDNLSEITRRSAEDLAENIRKSIQEAKSPALAIEGAKTT